MYLICKNVNEFSQFSCSVMSDSVQPHRRQLTRLLHPWDSPGKNAGVGCHILLQCMKMKSESHSVLSTLCDPINSTVYGILQARILEWIAFPCSRGSSQPRD